MSIYRVGTINKLLMEKIFDILKKDSEFRKEGVKEDLFKLEELNSKAVWDFSLPTLIYEYDLTKVHNHQLDITVFKKHLENFAFPLTLVDMSNLCIAGGCVKSLILNNKVNDIDIFIYGIKDVEKANTRIDKFITDLYVVLENIKSGKYVDLKIWNSQGVSSNKKVIIPTKPKKAISSVKNKKVDYSEDGEDDDINSENGEDDDIDSENNEEEDIDVEQTKNNNVDLSPNEYRIKNAHKYNPKLETDIFVMYNGNTVTIDVADLKIQLVLRLYNTISEILHGFDLGSSAVGFDGKNVYFTSLSKFCYENMINIYDGTRRSTSYEYRLEKYLWDGFKIVLPNLDIKKLRTQYFKYNLDEVCELPYMPFIYNNVDKNMIFVKRFLNKNSPMSQSDYLLEDFDIHDGKLNTETYMKLSNFNLNQLIKGDDRFIRFKIVNKEIEMILNKKDKISTWKLKFDCPILTPGIIINFYGKLLKDYKQNKLTLKNILKSFSILDPIKILTNLATDTDHKFMESLLDKQKDKLLEQLDKINKNNNILWITKNPTTQLTSSFNPIIEDPKDWYGNMYLELKLDEHHSKSGDHHSKKHTDKKDHDKSSKKSKKKEKHEE